MTFSKFNSNVCKLYKDIQILTIARIFKQEISKLMYKIKFRLVPNNLQNFLQKFKIFIRIIQDNDQVLNMPFLGLD